MLKPERMGRCVGFLLLLAGPVLGWAADLEDDLNQCAAIKRDRSRLACFDALASRVVQPLPAPEPAVPESPAAPVVAEDTPPPAPVDKAEASPVTSGTAPIVESAVRGKEEELFGFESQVQTTTPDEVRSRYMGEFTGWSGRTLFRLENGQVWKQTDSSRLVWNASNPTVTIRKGAFGTFRLGVEGVNKTVKVKRVK